MSNCFAALETLDYNKNISRVCGKVILSNYQQKGRLQI